MTGKLPPADIWNSEMYLIKFGIGDFRKSLIKSTLLTVLKRPHYPLEVMMLYMRWYVAYPLSFLHIEKMMGERNTVFDHGKVHRWIMKISPVLAKLFRSGKRLVGRALAHGSDVYQGEGAAEIFVPRH